MGRRRGALLLLLLLASVSACGDDRPTRPDEPQHLFVFDYSGDRQGRFEQTRPYDDTSKVGLGAERTRGDSTLFVGAIRARSDGTYELAFLSFTGVSGAGRYDACLSEPCARGSTFLYATAVRQVGDSVAFAGPVYVAVNGFAELTRLDDWVDGQFAFTAVYADFATGQVDPRRSIVVRNGRATSRVSVSDGVAARLVPLGPDRVRLLQRALAAWRDRR